jgi:hypothetical protein
MLGGLKFVPGLEVVDRHPDGLLQGSGEAFAAGIRDGDIGAFPPVFDPFRISPGV